MMRFLKLLKASYLANKRSARLQIFTLLCTLQVAVAGAAGAWLLDRNMEFITMFTNRARSSELDASVNALTKGESYVLQRYGVNSRDELNEKNALWMQQSGAQVGCFQESSENAKLTFSLS